jgi:glycogen synthase kinase 3 beta
MDGNSRLCSILHARVSDGGVFFSQRKFTNLDMTELSVRPDLIRQLVPPHCEPELASRSIVLDNFVPIPLEQMRLTLD